MSAQLSDLRAGAVGLDDDDVSWRRQRRECGEGVLDSNLARLEHVPSELSSVLSRSDLLRTVGRAVVSMSSGTFVLVPSGTYTLRDLVAVDGLGGSTGSHASPGGKAVRFLIFAFRVWFFVRLSRMALCV